MSRSFAARNDSRWPFQECFELFLHPLVGTFTQREVHRQWIGDVAIGQHAGIVRPSLSVHVCFIRLGHDSHGTPFDCFTDDRGAMQNVGMRSSEIFVVRPRAVIPATKPSAGVASSCAFAMARIQSRPKIRER